MSGRGDIGGRVRQCLVRYLESSGRADAKWDDRTSLHSGLGLSSDEGLDFVLDLCDEFEFEFPADFNPVVHRDGKRGNNVKDLISEVTQFLAASEVGG